MEVLEYLYQAAGKDLEQLPGDNPFKELGVDGGAARLGWVKPPSWEMVEEVLCRLDQYLEGKDEFVFIGMGGSINGIKTILALAPEAPIFCIDSLDPAAAAEIISGLKNKDRTLIIPITKSGTTTESQLIAATFRELLGRDWAASYLFLSDKPSFDKLDKLGWEECSRDTIQIDGRSDIGGRFTSPHTLIFLLPLYLAMGRDKDKVKELYVSYLSEAETIDKNACALAKKYLDKDPAFFSVPVKEEIRREITTWITQLFQESLGSKKEGFYVKTFVGDTADEDFCPVKFESASKDMFVYLMGLMHFLHIFVACFAYYHKINFVNQPCVETYKKTMKELQGAELSVPEKVDLGLLKEKIRAKLTSKMKFIEVLLYFQPDREQTERLQQMLKSAFPEKISFIFLGSDWNHHSYQAAFKDIYSLYVILTRDYLKQVAGISPETLQNNIDTMRRICQATYQTIEDKALYLSL